MTATIVELKHGLKVNGVETKRISMRAPTVKDVIVSEKLAGSEAEREVALFASLAELAPADIHAMHLADYKLLQQAFQGFFD